MSSATDNTIRQSGSVGAEHGLVLAKRPSRPLCLASVLAFVLSVVSSSPGYALSPVTAGPYTIQAMTRPAVVPIGKADLVIKLTDKAGTAVEDAAITATAQMPGMAMGEKEQVAVSVAGQPGAYSAPVQFAMAGTYEVRIQIDGKAGPARAVVRLSTGQDSLASGGFSPLSLIPWIVLLALAAFVAYRMRRTGQRVAWNQVLTRPVVGGLLLLAIGLLVAGYAVRHFRREGAMTPLEAQGMEMSTPAPPGVTPVVLAVVRRRSISSTVRYTGQAAGFNEQPVYPRVTGVITWMPYYAGDRVRAGQLLARLDTSQIDPQVAERQAAAAMAEQGIAVAQSEGIQAERAVDQARAELSGKEGAVSEAEASLAAARQERDNAQADLEAARTMVEDARAQLQATEADQEYWVKQIERTEALYKSGVVSGEEFQKDRAQARNADAKVRQAQARVQQVNAQVRSAESGVKRADAMIRAAQAKVSQSQAELAASRAQLRSAQAGVNVADRKVRQAEAGAAQGRASVASAATQRGYTQIRAEIDGVITQRPVSPGVLVNPGQAILRVAQLSPVRVQANVAETDLARIRVGNAVTVRGQSNAWPAVAAKVSSITPAVDPSSRTGVVEAIIPNRDRNFVPGSYVVMEISTGQARSALTVPSAAIQQDGGEDYESSSGRAVVWVARPGAAEGELTAHRVTVRTGIRNSSYTEVVSGLAEDQMVVLRGQDNLTEGTAVADAGKSPAATRRAAGMTDNMASMGHGAAASRAGAVQTATVEITDAGYRPGAISLKQGMPARVTFIRKTDATCGTEILLPDYKIRKPLPLNRPVTIEFTPRKGEFMFTCPMNMLKGKVIAK